MVNSLMLQIDKKYSKHRHQNGERLAQLYAKFETLDGYTVQARAQTLLRGLGFGRRRCRVPSRRLFRWLEQRLQQFKGTLLIISHDHDFLDSTIDNIESLYYFPKPESMRPHWFQLNKLTGQ